MECVICLPCQPLIYFKRNIDLIMIIGLDVSFSESILDLAFWTWSAEHSLCYSFPSLYLFVFIADVFEICHVCWATALC